MTAGLLVVISLLSAALSAVLVLWRVHTWLAEHTRTLALQRQAIMELAVEQGILRAAAARKDEATGPGVLPFPRPK